MRRPIQNSFPLTPVSSHRLLQSHTELPLSTEKFTLDSEPFQARHAYTKISPKSDPSHARGTVLSYNRVHDPALHGSESLVLIQDK